MSISDLGEDFNPALALAFDRAAVVRHMKKVAEQSSQNFKRNADVYLSGIKHDKDKIISI